MKITILCVGRIKEKFYSQAIAEYVKRLGRYCQIAIVEVADEKTPEKASEKEELQIKEKEGQRLLDKMKDDMYVIALAINGQQPDSVGLANKMKSLMTYQTSHIAFVIGGSLGLSESVLNRADEQLSFSKMTFPHQLMRVILLEQIYRSFRIIHGEPYHK
ncbi:MAG: 23S rRNA (pseudouridine(1915)-N(3))-methyltransferase RlmH [Lachnospiraceae bacterium]|jgi:23S rRNA (pseudouridine1915-N3)-methyltransferase|nr:23S rRNA (pseudouridine(1915)-N(3))-methyltransferase RlmH [Lachnospiraceae bacterium]